MLRYEREALVAQHKRRLSWRDCVPPHLPTITLKLAKKYFTLLQAFSLCNAEKDSKLSKIPDLRTPYRIRMRHGATTRIIGRYTRGITGLSCGVPIGVAVGVLVAVGVFVTVGVLVAVGVLVNVGVAGTFVKPASMVVMLIRFDAKV
jgi:hypothetical protein